ncbi:MAG: SDR family oxidoreductase [Acidimicrobiales bacterium]
MTGVSREIGIGATVAQRLSDEGATVFATGWPPHDAEMPWGEETAGLGFEVHRHDLELPDTPAALVDEVLDRHNKLDIVVAVHARSSEQTLADVTATELDRSWAANVRSIVLLAQRFAERHGPAPTGQSPTGRMIWFTSGQHREPMDNTLAYAVTKGALHQMTATLGRALSQSGIVANCINPGPVDTGWADPTFRTELKASFPDQRWGTPTDVANLVAFLVGDEGSWIRGQVIDSEGGFDRSSLRG